MQGISQMQQRPFWVADVLQIFKLNMPIDTKNVYKTKIKMFYTQVVTHISLLFGQRSYQNIYRVKIAALFKNFSQKWTLVIFSGSKNNQFSGNYGRFWSQRVIIRLLFVDWSSCKVLMTAINKQLVGLKHNCRQCLYNKKISLVCEIFRP